MTTRKTGDWGKARALLGAASRRIAAAEAKAVKQEAQFFRKKVVEGMRKQAPGGKKFAPIAPTTHAIRRAGGFRGRKAMIVRADLRNSITVVSKGVDAFVGVLRTARSGAGKALVNIARIHEFGLKRLIKITPRMRRFLQAKFRAGGLKKFTGRSVGFIKIKARPYLQPVADKHFGKAREVRDRFNGRLSKLLKKDYGRA